MNFYKEDCDCVYCKETRAMMGMREDAEKAPAAMLHGTPRELTKDSSASIERAVKQQRAQ